LAGFLALLKPQPGGNRRTIGREFWCPYELHGRSPWKEAGTLGERDGVRHGPQVYPNSKLPDRWGSTREAIFRWKKDPKLGFPKPAMTINGRDFYDEEVLENWEEAHKREETAE
jgi:hypothetical protein